MKVFLDRPPHNNVPTVDTLDEMSELPKVFELMPPIDGKIYEVARCEREFLQVDGK